VSTEPSIVPVPPGPGGDEPSDGSHAPTPRRRTWPWWLAGGLFFTLSAAVLAAFTVEIPYYEFRPGSARPTAPLVEVVDAEEYPPAGEIAFTTVSLQRSTVASYVLAWFDGDVEIVDEAVVLGDRSPGENRQFNLQLMDTSKQDAVRQALLALGYEVPVTVDGMVVVEVLEGSPAEGVLAPGDTIVSIDGRELIEAHDLFEIMDGRAPGETVMLAVEAPDRSGVRMVDVVLGENPEDPSQGLIGVSLQPRNPSYEFPFGVDIDSGSVGGPSAGLAFTLGVVDVLTPGELTGGLRVAATGTIDGQGNVGPVGGVPQKAAVVVDEGYDVFLVPSSEAAQVSERVGDDVRVVPVGTLRDALDALASLGGSGIGPAPQPG
jgi:PDZ domain-containing protein